MIHERSGHFILSLVFFTWPFLDQCGTTRVCLVRNEKGDPCNGLASHCLGQFGKTCIGHAKVNPSDQVCWHIVTFDQGMLLKEGTER